jgi:hypothetical protein
LRLLGHNRLDVRDLAVATDPVHDLIDCLGGDNGCGSGRVPDRRGRSILATLATVHIEGIPFSVEEAAEFATRTRTYVGANPELLTPGEALAAQLEHRAAEYGDVVVDLTDEEKAAAAAVLQDWRRSPDVPDAARALYARLAAD